MANENNERQLDYTADEINTRLGMVTDMTETNGMLNDIADGVAETSNNLNSLAGEVTKTNGKVEEIAESVNGTSGKVDDLSVDVNNNMFLIDSKITSILRNPADYTTGFRVATGVYEEPEDTKQASALIIECPNAPKLVVVMADNTPKDTIPKTTYEIILESLGEKWLVGVVGQRLIQIPHGASQTTKYWSYMSTMSGDSTGAYPTNVFTMLRDVKPSDGKDKGVVLGATMRKAGKYNWTAYYWD